MFFFCPRGPPGGLAGSPLGYKGNIPGFFWEGNPLGHFSPQQKPFKPETLEKGHTGGCAKFFGWWRAFQTITLSPLGGKGYFEGVLLFSSFFGFFSPTHIMVPQDSLVCAFLVPPPPRGLFGRSLGFLFGLNWFHHKL